MTEVKPEETQAVEAPPEAQPVEAQSQVITSTSEAAEPLAPPPVEVAKTEEPPKPAPDPAKLKAEREAKLRKIREEKLREQKREEARQERLEEIREAKAKAAREAKARQAKAQQGAERSSASASRQNNAGRAAAGNDPGAMRQWQGAISAAIHGRMNANAAAGTSGGTAVVRFTVMRSGQVTGAGVARSSGVGQIDSAALVGGARQPAGGAARRDAVEPVCLHSAQLPGPVSSSGPPSVTTDPPTGRHSLRVGYE